MKKIIITLLLYIMLYIMGATQTFAVELGMNQAHFARYMEYYYQNPRPDILPAMLEKFDESGLLNQPDKRLMVAAFFAELAQKHDLDLRIFLRTRNEKSRAMRYTLAWMTSLADLPQKNIFLDNLLGEDDQLLKRQLQTHAYTLDNLDKLTDKSIPGLYLAAYMAGGDRTWIDKLIRTACGSGPNSREASALLYEYSPRHEGITQELTKALKSGDQGCGEVIGKILNR